MIRSTPRSCIAVDIGNHCVKLGRFALSHDAGAILQGPVATLSIPQDALDTIRAWLESSASSLGRADQAEPCAWWIASVDREGTERVEQWIEANRPDDVCERLRNDHLPMPLDVIEPEKVGIDRLVAAMAAHAVCGPGRPLIVIDLGTAITIDAVSKEGVFLGGTIAPGVALSARSLHTWTDLLPWVNTDQWPEVPPVVGRSTEQAIRGGLYWGTLGAIREIITRMAEYLGEEPDLVVTGGDSAMVSGHAGGALHHLPHLTLIGIALAAQHASI